MSRYATAEAFRTALEERLRRRSAAERVGLQRLRKWVVFERLLVRLQADPDSPWSLKGAFALDLRLGVRARTTRDLDLGLDKSSLKVPVGSAKEVAMLLREAAEADLRDFFAFRVPESGARDIPAGTAEAYRFTVQCWLAGRLFEAITVDVAVGEPPIGVEEVAGPDLLAFAGISKQRFRATSKAQHFAEKIHALSRPWEDRDNTRTKDLVDLVLFLDLGLPDEASVARAIQAVFSTRGTHPLPADLPDPPEGWAQPFARLADEVGLSEKTPEAAMDRLNAFWRTLFPRSSQ